MLSKKWLFSVLLFGAITTHAMEPEQKKEPKIKYFLEYEKKKFEITRAGLQQSKILKKLLKTHENDKKTDEKYKTFHDQEENFKIPLNTLLDKIKKVKVDLYDIQIFIMLSEKTINMEDFTLPLIIRQINLANVLNNQTILDKAAEHLAKKIKKEKVLMNFFRGKGLILTIIDQLPDDFLNHVLKKKLLEGITVPSQQIITGHTDYINSVAWSKDGRLASGSKDKTIKIWDLQAGTSKTLMGHTGSVNSVAFSLDGKKLASGSFDETVRIWDPKTGKIIKVLSGHTNSVNSVAWSPDGKWLASGSDDTTVRVWDLKTGTSKTLEDHTDYVLGVAWSPDGKWLASGSLDTTVRIWNLTTGTSKTLEGHKTSVSVAWSLDGKKLASGSFDDTVITLWHPDLFNDITFQQAITMLALQTRYNQLKTSFNITTNKKIFEIVKTLSKEKILAMRNIGWITTRGIIGGWLEKFGIISQQQLSEKDKKRIFLLEQDLFHLKQAKEPFTKNTLLSITKKAHYLKDAMQTLEGKQQAQKLLSKILAEAKQMKKQEDKRRISILKQSLSELEKTKKDFTEEFLSSIKQKAHTLREKMETYDGVLYAEELITKILTRIEQIEQSQKSGE